MLTKWIISRIPNHEDVKNERVRSAYGKAASLVGIGCNVLLFAGKLVAGLLSGSVAIMADAVNNLSDASSSLISLLGFKLADRPADAEHPYGHGRFEYLSGMTVAVMILAMVLGLVACYAFGTAWFMVVYTRQIGEIGLMASLTSCVFPFILPDCAKIALAILLAKRLPKRLIRRV